MRKKIFKISFLFVIIFVFTAPIYAEEDITPPTGTILINNGALYTNTRNVTLTLSATDDISGVAEMRFNNGTGSYSTPEPYSTTKLWTLSQSADVSKTVRVKFKDQAGNETTTGIYATITLDVVTPVITLIGSTTINLNVGETYTDAGATALDNDVTDLTSSIVTINPVDVNTAGTYTVTYNVADLAGNSATEVTRTVIVNSINNNTPTETFIIRNGSSVIYSESVPLPASGTVSINDTNTSPASHSIDSRSVLAVLKTIDEGSDAFSITNLPYYNKLGSFYLKCILPNSGTELCDNWLFTVNNVYPPAIEKSILSGGETVYLYFGPQNKVELGSSNINTSDTLTVTAKKYDYENNAWLTRTGVTVGLTQPNPNDSSSPLEIQTHPVDENGQVVFSEIPVGSYNVGIQQDYYSPTESLTVSTIPSGGGCGGCSNRGGRVTSAIFDVQRALAYLRSAQSPNGSFGGSLLYTDWVAIAFGALNVTDSSKDKLLAYFNSHNAINPLLTDNERHAMALLALRQNPYSFNGVNYIKAIISSFDGAQFGDVNLVNDDIFALIPLKNSGYTTNDDIIIKDVAFLISKQKTDGSWEESVDVTAAAIQALKSFESIAGVAGSLLKATNYLANEQRSDGGWNSVYSTSWTMQAMSALSASWTKGGHTPNDYLGGQQMGDGATLPSSETLPNRIWATSYAIPAALGKPWSAIMQSIPKPTEQSALVAVNPPTTHEKTVLISKAQESKVVVSKDLLIDINTEKITPDTLIATAADSLPAQAGLPTNGTTPRAVPIVLGVLSGIVILYLVKKFLIK